MGIREGALESNCENCENQLYRELNEVSCQEEARGNTIVTFNEIWQNLDAAGTTISSFRTFACSACVDFIPILTCYTTYVRWVGVYECGLVQVYFVRR